MSPMNVGWFPGGCPRTPGRRRLLTVTQRHDWDTGVPWLLFALFTLTPATPTTPIGGEGSQHCRTKHSAPYGSALPATSLHYRPTSPSDTSARCRSLLAWRRLSSTSEPVVGSRRSRRRLTAIAASSNTTTVARSSPSGFATGAEVSVGPRGADTSIRGCCPVEDRCSRMLTSSTGATATTTARSMSGIVIRKAIDISGSQASVARLAFSFHHDCGRWT